MYIPKEFSAFVSYGFRRFLSKSSIWLIGIRDYFYKIGQRPFMNNYFHFSDCQSFLEGIGSWLKTDCLFLRIGNWNVLFSWIESNRPNKLFLQNIWFSVKDWLFSQYCSLIFLQIDFKDEAISREESKWVEVCLFFPVCLIINI